MSKLKFRTVFFLIYVGLALAALFLSDPDSKIVQGLPFGATALAGLVSVSAVFFYVIVLHISRKGLFDYLDLSALYNKALESSQGAGLALIAAGLFMISISLMAIAAMMKF